MEHIKKNFKWIVFAICTIAFITIMCAIIKFKILPIDTWAIDLVVNKLRTGWLTAFFKVFTFFGEAKLLIPVGCLGVLIGFFIFKDKKRAFCYISNLVVIAGLNWTIKHIVQRLRPDQSLRLVEESDFSFPSGHAMISTAFYGLIIYFIWKNFGNKTWGKIICFCLAFLIIMIDFSRVYLGVHYISDVLAGSLISIAYLIVAIEVAKKFIFKEDKNK